MSARGVACGGVFVHGVDLMLCVICSIEQDKNLVTNLSSGPTGSRLRWTSMGRASPRARPSEGCRGAHGRGRGHVHGRVRGRGVRDELVGRRSPGSPRPVAHA